MKTTFALLALVAVSGVASAQTARLTDPFRVQVGAGFPDAAGNRAGLNVGLGYDFYQSSINAQGQYIRGGLHADALFFNQGGARTNVYSIGPNGRFYIANTANASFYLGAGLGVYFFDTRVLGQNFNDTYFGGRLAIGAELNKKLYVDLGWNVLADSNSYFTATIGTKF